MLECLARDTTSFSRTLPAIKEEVNIYFVSFSRLFSCP